MPTLEDLQDKFGVNRKTTDRERPVWEDEDQSERLIVDRRAGRRSTEFIDQKLHTLQVTPVVNRPR